jgi:cysteinyl-tRNA synthetase
MSDDLASPAALALLSEVSRQVLGTLVHPSRMDHFVALLEAIDALFGTRLSEVRDISDTQKRLIKERETARSDKDWARSDAIRDELASQGIGLRDRDSLGAIWYYL